MNALATLRDFKVRFDQELEKFFEEAIGDAREKDAFTAGMLEHCRALTLAGGKRLRPALMYYGYRAVGGREEEKILKASMSIELIHSFLLMHDDIIDRDGLRHGIETLHARYARLGKELFSVEGEHFGLSMAMIAGDMIGALGNRVLYESGLEPALVIQALSRLQSIIGLTVIGQTKDVYIEYAKKASEEEILRMYEYKTARYTVEGPLHLGAILGGASSETLEALSRYAIPLGIAFQIQDDILGVFGSEEKLGKPVGSDIAEGKFTLLVSKAMKNANAQEQEELHKLLALGSGLKFSDTERFREILRTIGSLAYASDMARRYIEEGKQALVESGGIDSEAREFLLGIADYMAQREY